MRRHPSSRTRRIVADAQRQLIADIEAGRRVDLELFMGGPVPESAEVAQARMDAEACEVGSSNAATRPAAGYPITDLLKAVGAGLTLYGMVLGVCVAGEFVAGWPL